MRAAGAERREVKVALLNYRKDRRNVLGIELLPQPVFDERGEVTNFFASQVDVTGARNGDAARERLVAVERRLADAQKQLMITLAAAAVAGTWDWDFPG